MSYFKNQLATIMQHVPELRDVHFVNNACYGTLDDDLRMKVQFATSNVAGQYDALHLSIINCQEGVVPYIWNYNGKLSWYAYQPTLKDYKLLAMEVEEYALAFSAPEPTMEQPLC